MNGQQLEINPSKEKYIDNEDIEDDIDEGNKKDEKEDEKEDEHYAALFQPSLTVMDDGNDTHDTHDTNYIQDDVTGNTDNNLKVVKDLHRNKDVFFGNTVVGKSNPWKVGNTITLCYNSSNEPIITIGPHCKS